MVNGMGCVCVWRVRGGGRTIREEKSPPRTAAGAQNLWDSAVREDG